MLIFDNNFFSQHSTPAAMLFFYLVAMSNERGEVYTSIRELATKTSLPINTVRQKILELESEHTIHTAVTHRGSIITICNIEEYKNSKRRVTHSSHTDNTLNTIENSEYSFDKLWDLYRKKKGRNETLERRWYNLSIDEKQKIFQFIPAYVALTEETYRKNFQTFLNQRTWEDEKIYTHGISVPVGSFNAKLVEDQNLFPLFVQRFNMKVRGSGIPAVTGDGLTEKRRVLFNIAYCLHFNKMRDVVEKAIKNPRLNGSMGFAADFDYIFEPNNFLRIYEGR